MSEVDLQQGGGRLLSPESSGPSGPLGGSVHTGKGKRWPLFWSQAEAGQGGFHSSATQHEEALGWGWTPRLGAGSGTVCDPWTEDRSSGPAHTEWKGTEVSLSFQVRWAQVHGRKMTPGLAEVPATDID